MSVYQRIAGDDIITDFWENKLTDLIIRRDNLNKAYLQVKRNKGPVESQMKLLRKGRVYSADLELTVKTLDSKSINTLEDFFAIKKDKSPDEIINAIKTVVDRIYVVRSGDGGKINIFLKGEDIDYERFFEQSGTAQEGSFSCDSNQCRKLYPHLRRNTAPCRM